jgi:hypothetical protein
MRRMVMARGCRGTVLWFGPMPGVQITGWLRLSGRRRFFLGSGRRRFLIIEAEPASNPELERQPKRERERVRPH